MQYVDWLFGSRKTPQEQLRQHQRSLERTQRELDRERVKLETQEKKLINDIRKAAKEGHNSSVQVMAKDLVRTRNHIHKFYTMKTQLQTISLRIQSVRGSQQMAQSMAGASKLLGQMNRSMNLPQLSKIAAEFEKQNDVMDQRQEMIDDVVDDGLMDDEGVDEESEEIVSKVLDEIGIDLNTQLSAAPEPVKTGTEDLEARLNSLKK